MKRNGNINSNRTYNPQNVKPHIPLDVDEVDAVLERFIRQKYDQQAFLSGTVRPAQRHDTGSTRSSEDQPPPLPPKPARRFGFGLRAASSTIPSSRIPQFSPPDSPTGSNGYGQPPSPIRVNKQSRIFGASVGGTTGDNTESKLATLRDMGFPDDKRNANILKGLGGNLERAIESLVRLGEGNAPSSTPRAPIPAGNVTISQPLNLSLSSKATQPTANQPAAHTQTSAPIQANSQTTNQANSQHSQVLNISNSFQTQSYNPFETSNAQSAAYPLEQAFERMHFSQPLFPNATGGYPSQQQQIQEARLQQSMTPPVPQLPHHYYQSNTHVQQIQVPTGSYNPFVQNTQQVAVNSSISYPYIGQQESVASTYNPFLHSPSSTQSPATEYPLRTSQAYFQDQQPQQQQPRQQLQHNQQPPQLQAPPQPQQQQPPFVYDTASQGQQSSNLYMFQEQPAINLAQSPPQQSQFYSQSPPQPLQPQQTGRVDKSSILALYNYPQLAPHTLPITPYQPASSTSPLATGHPQKGLSTQQQRSVTTPAALSSGSRNPFHTDAPSSQAGARPPAINGVGISRHVSQESVDIGGFQNGRHSPDAFASLSARTVR